MAVVNECYHSSSTLRSLSINLSMNVTRYALPHLLITRYSIFVIRRHSHSPNVTAILQKTFPIKAFPILRLRIGMHITTCEWSGIHFIHLALQIRSLIAAQISSSQTILPFGEAAKLKKRPRRFSDMCSIDCFYLMICVYARKESNVF